MEKLEIFELNSCVPDKALEMSSARRKKKKESHNAIVLQDYCRKAGVSRALKTDNAQTEPGETWTKHCCTHCITQAMTEPHHPQQNPAEPKIGLLCSIPKNVVWQFKVPKTEHDW
eukprot:13132363-Ditylum_brightwellii.AAC.1